MKGSCGALAFLLLVGCSSDSTTSAPAAVIGTAGGVIAAAEGGASVAIPANALADDAKLAAADIDDLVAAGYEAAPGFVEGAPIASVELTPHGTTFAEPVTLTFPYDGVSQDLVVLRLADASDTEWEAVGPLTYGDGVVSVQINSFSTYTLAAVKAGECPCFNGSVLADMETYGAANGFARVAQFGSTQTFVYYQAGRDYGVAGINQNTCMAYTASSGMGIAVDQLWASFFPSIPAANRNYAAGPGMRGLQQTVTAQEKLACQALVKAAANGTQSVQLGFTATGLPAGAAVVVEDHVSQQLTVADGQLEWSGALVAIGAPYTTSIVQQPSGATCTLKDGTGTATSENVLVTIECTPTAPTTPTCPCFDATDVAASLALPGAQCYVDDATVMPFAGTVTLVRADHDGAEEITGVALAGTTLVCGHGCQDTTSTPNTCSSLGRADIIDNASLTQPLFDACKALVTDACTVGCSVTLTGSGVLPASYTKTAECVMIIDPTGGGFTGVVVRDAPLPIVPTDPGFPIDPEAPATYSDYVAGGGSVLGFFMVGGAAAPAAGLTGNLSDFSFIGGDSVGMWELLPANSTFALPTYDATAKTFRLELTVEVQGGTATWPPPGGAASPGTIDLPAATGDATIVVEGPFTQLP